MRRMFRSLASHNFRIWFVTATFSNVGAWMQATAQNWVVLTELTDNDAVAVGFTMACQLAPQLLLAPVAGLLADRVNRRTILLVSQSIMTVLTLGIGALLASGRAELWHFFVFALVFGVVNAVDSPARNTFVSDLVPETEIPNGVALNLASHHAARLVGPAIAGIVIATLGSGWVFMINTVTFVPLIVALFLLRRSELIFTARPPRQRGDLLGGIRYIAGRRDLVIVLAMLFLLGIFGMNFPLFASTMAVDFGAGPGEFGLLTSVMAVGSLVGALIAAARERARIRTIVIAGCGMGVAALVASLMPTFWSFAAMTVLIGLAGVTTFTTASAYMQASTAPELRGRVMSIHMAVLAAGTPLGAPLIGVVANEFGPRVALASGCVLAMLACTIGVTWYLVHRRSILTARATGAPIALQTESL